MVNLAWLDVEALDGTFGSDPNADEAISLASNILWSFSGRKYGRTRTVTETYECACRSGRQALPANRWNTYPTLDDGAVRNVSDGGCGCSTGHARLRLRGTPIRIIHAVRRGSEVLDPSMYRVENSGLLTLDPGSPGDVCGLEVTYTYGTGVPTAGRLAAKLLAQEFLRSWSGDEECRLPDRVTNVSRQGISFTVMDKQEFLDDLRTGILEVDMFLRAANPDRARKRARVFSPDLPKAYRTTAGPSYVPVQPIDGSGYSLRIRQGLALSREFSRSIDGVAESLAGYSFAAQIRAGESPDSELLLDLGPYLSVNPVDPTVLALYVPASVTGGLDKFPPGSSWELLMWPTGNPDGREIWLEGYATLDLTGTAVPA